MQVIGGALCSASIGVARASARLSACDYGLAGAIASVSFPVK